MTEKTMAGRDPVASAAERLAEIEQLFQRLRLRLDQAIEAIGEPTSDTPATTLKKLDDLQAAHLKVLTAEDAFHAKLGQDDANAIDYDAIRAEIGRKLDRIRAILAAEEVPQRPD